MALPPRLPQPIAPAGCKICGICGRSFARPHNYSKSQWADKVFCSNTCAQHIPLSERLYDAIDKDEQTGCWNWTGTRVKGGYGRIIVTEGRVRKQIIAHRAAYSEWVGPVPNSLMVLHSCDNPSCVNPLHLRLGTHADNMADKVERKRCRNQYGKPKKYASA